MAILSGLTINNTTGYLKLPIGNTSERPRVTLTGAGKPLDYAANGLQLYIPTTAWAVYQNLPAYLIGLITTTSINDGDATITITLTHTTKAYLLRDDAWNAVDLSGWAEVESGKNYISGYSGMRVYTKTLPAGAYVLDNNSAMYFFDTSGLLRINNDTGRVELFNRQYVWTALTIPFYARSILTTGYLMGGYKDGVAWNNVNRVVNATDTTTNLGDGAIERSFNYQQGASSKNIAFVFGAANAHGTASNYTIAFNMRTETQYTPSGGTRNQTNNRYTAACLFQEHYYAWITGGGSGTTEEYNLITETVTGSIAATFTVGGGSVCCMNHENLGVLYWDNTTSQTFLYSTRTALTRSGTTPANHHQQKTVHGKGNFCYAGNEGDYAGGNNLRKTNMYTNVSSGTVAKPVTNSGEENFTLGQDWQYMLGMYNGAQNNLAWRFYYTTETGSSMGTTTEPKGKGGASSGQTAWRD